MTKIEELIISLQSHGDRFPQEKEACEGIVSWIREHGKSAFQRENLDGHLTASMFIVNPERTRVLLMFHKKLERWQQFG